MATPIIQSTGSTSGAGTAGRGRNDLVVGETVTLSDTEAANLGATYAWVMEDRPIGSSAVLTAPTTSTPTFTPDVTGSYRFSCTVDGTDSSVEVFAVPLTVTGARIPSYQEQLEYDGGSPANSKGWHEALTVFMRNVDSSIGGSGVTLNGAYNFGGAGAGRVISANAAQPVEVQRSTIGAVTTNADGYAVVNTTAAAAGAQQWSPTVSIRGNGWATGAAASRVVNMALQTQTVQGSEPTGGLSVLGSINAAAFTKLAEFNWDGSLSQLRVGSGSAARPAITSLSDVFSGFYFAGNLIAFGVNSGLRAAFSDSEATFYMNTQPGTDGTRTLGSATNGWQQLFVTRLAVGTAQTVGALLENKTAALVGAQVQRSPSLQFTGHAWDVDGAVTNSVDWQLQNVPAAGNSVLGALGFRRQVAGGGYTDILTVDTSGGLTRLDGNASGLIASVASSTRLLITTTVSAVTVTPLADATYALGTSALGWNDLAITRNSVGTAQGIAATLNNKTAATAGNQQNSPSLAFVSRGWETTGGTSQQLTIVLQAQPVQASTVGGMLAVMSSHDLGAYIPRGGFWARSNAVSSFHVFHNTSGQDPTADGLLFELNGANAFCYNRETGYLSLGGGNTEQLRLSAAAVASASGVSWNLYNSGHTGDANFERLTLSWSANVAQIRAAAGGSGTQRSLELLSGDGSGIRCNNSGRLATYGAAGYQWGISHSADGVGLFINGRITTGTTAAVQLGNDTFGTGISDSSGIQTIVRATATINQSGTAGYRALHVDITETTVGSGTKALIEARVGAATKMLLESSGALTVTRLAVAESTDMATYHGIVIRNTTAATVGSDQSSAFLILEGRAWDTDGAVSQPVSFGLQCEAVAGATVGATLYIHSSLNGSQAEVAYFRANGELTIRGNEFYLGSGGGERISVASNQFAFYVDSTAYFYVWSTGAQFDNVDVEVLNGDLTVTNGDVDASGGFRRLCDTMTDGDGVMGVNGTATLTRGRDGSDAAGWIPCPRPGSVVELATWVDADVTAGTADTWVQKSTDGGDTWSDLWGSSGSPVNSLSSGGNPELDYSTLAKDTNSFADGDLLRIRLVQAGTVTGATRIWSQLTIEC